MKHLPRHKKDSVAVPVKQCPECQHITAACAMQQIALIIWKPILHGIQANINKSEQV
jgi:hypothetical protein